MIEVIFETIIVWLFQYPGAFLRWIFLKNKKTFKSLLEEDPYINATFSILMIAGIVLLIRYIFTIV